MSYNIFLDDYRTPDMVTWHNIGEHFTADKDWVLCANYDDFVATIEREGVPTFVSFDHDLADLHYQGDFTTERTGNDCAKFLVEWCYQNEEELPKWAVHSMNPVGAANIRATLEGAR